MNDVNGLNDVPIHQSQRQKVSLENPNRAMAKSLVVRNFSGNSKTKANNATVKQSGYKKDHQNTKNDRFGSKKNRSTKLVLRSLLTWLFHATCSLRMENMQS